MEQKIVEGLSYRQQRTFEDFTIKIPCSPFVKNWKN